MMSIDAIGAIGADVPRTSLIAPSSSSGADFLGMVVQGLEQVDQSLKSADASLRGLAAGSEVPIHEVMISMEQARMDLMLAAEIRNRVVEAYQELTRMQL